MDNERYIIKYYYNDNLIGYHNSYGESRGMVWTRIYAGNDSQYIKKYNSLQGAKIASNSPYYINSHDLIINTDASPITVHFDNCFIKEIRNKGFGILEDKVRKEICKLSEIDNEEINLSELEEIEANYINHIQEEIDSNKNPKNTSMQEALIKMLTEEIEGQMAINEKGLPELERPYSLSSRTDGRFQITSSHPYDLTDYSYAISVRADIEGDWTVIDLAKEEKDVVHGWNDAIERMKEIDSKKQRRIDRT